MDLVQVLVATIGILTIRQVGIVIYRLYFHPLARFPGPRLAAASTFYELYQDYFVGIGGQFCFKLDKLHEQYGPIVRVGPNEIHVKDSSWIEVLYPGRGAVRDRDPRTAKLVGTEHGSFGTVPHRLHRIRRAAVLPAFSRGSVVKLVPKIQGVTNQLRESLLRRGHDGAKPVDVRVDFAAWSVDFITSIIFEEGSLDLLKEESRALDWFDKTTMFNIIFPWVKVFLWVISIGLKLPLTATRALFPSMDAFFVNYSRTRKAAERAHDQWKKGTLQSIKNTPDGLNVYESLLVSRLPDHDKNVTRLHQEAFQILGAGTFSTARVFSFATYFVLADNELHTKLKTELRKLMPDPDSEPDLALLESSQLLNAIIREALRISEPVLTRIPMIAPEEDLRYRNWTIPRGTAISMTTSSPGMDPEIFPQPREFQAQRWMQAPEVVEKLKRASVPFGKGSRQCIGLELAWAELFIGLGTVFRKLDLELYDTIRERDVDYKRAGMLGEPSLEAKGIRVLAKPATG